MVVVVAAAAMKDTDLQNWQGRQVVFYKQYHGKLFYK
jgi:hypothetical protein